MITTEGARLLRLYIILQLHVCSPILSSKVTRIWYILDSPDNQGNDVIDRNVPSDKTIQDSLIAENHKTASGNVAKVYEIYLNGAEDNKMRDGILQSLQEAWKAANPR